MQIIAADPKMESLAALIDHTLLVPTTTLEQTMLRCEEAVEYGFAAVCIPPCYVPAVAGRLYGSDVRVGTVVGFPCGYNSVRQKVQEAAEMVACGANELDMVVTLGWILENRFDLVAEEIAQVVQAAQPVPLKVIIECCYLTDAQKIAAARAVVIAGAAYVKTSTGFGSSGATAGDVKLLAAEVKGKIGVKAAGGIRSLKDCLSLIAAGATRIGTSSGVQIMQQWQAQQAAGN